MALSTKERKVLTAALANKIVAESIADQIDEGSAGLVDVSAEELAAVTNGDGAALVGIEDAATIYTATTVEAALAEVKVQANLSTTTITSTLAIANATPSVTFDNAVGAKTLVIRKCNQVVSVYIPAGTTADAGAGKIACGAIAATFRPTANQTFPCVVTNNAAQVAGTVTVKSTGVIEFAGTAAGGNFTDDAAGGWPAFTVTYISDS